MASELPVLSGLNKSHGLDIHIRAQRRPKLVRCVGGAIRALRQL